MLPNIAPAPPALLSVQNAIAALPIPTNVPEDELIGLWLHGKSSNTIRACHQDVAAFREFIGKPIRPTSIRKRYPRRRVIASVLAATHRAIYACCGRPSHETFAQQQMVEMHACVAWHASRL
jgi:hypothetical protein